AGDAAGARGRRGALRPRRRAEVTSVEAVRRREDPWGRLAWQVPLATFLTLIGLMSFLRLLEPSDVPPPAPRPLDVEVADVLPPPPMVAPPPAAPTPARPTPPVARERRPVEIQPPVEPP